jgi:hypothetical protein
LDSEEEDDEEEEDDAAGAAGRAVDFSRGMKCNRMRVEGLMLTELECVWCNFVASKQRWEWGLTDSLMDRVQRVAKESNVIAIVIAVGCGGGGGSKKQKQHACSSQDRGSKNVLKRN